MKQLSKFLHFCILFVCMFFLSFFSVQAASKATNEYVPAFTKNVSASTQIPDVFTDNVCSGLKDGVTLSQIQNIENDFFRNMALAMHDKTYETEFRVQFYDPYLTPQIKSAENKISSYNWLDNVTGMYANVGDTLVVLVGDTKGETVFLRQINLDKEAEKKDGYGDNIDYPLSTGINKFRASKQGLIYVMYHLASQRAVMPAPIQINFASGAVNGYFDINRHKNNDWIKLLDNAKSKFLDIRGNYSQATFPVASYKTYCPTDGEGLISALDSISYLERELMGHFKYTNRQTGSRQYFCVVYQNYMYAATDHTGYHVSTLGSLCSLSNLRGKKVWGPAHELGHQNQTRPGFKWAALAEVSNNLFSAYVQTKMFGECQLFTDKPSTGRNNHYENAYNMIMVPTKKGNNDYKVPHMLAAGEFNRLTPFWQLYLYSTFVKNQPDFYYDLFEKIRVEPNMDGATSSGQISLMFTNYCSQVMHEDLSDFFAAWNFYEPMENVHIGDYSSYTVNLTNSWANSIKTLNAGCGTKPVYAIKYMDEGNLDIYINKKAIEPGTATRSGNMFSLKGWKNAVAYEVYDNGKLVFIASKPEFKLIRQVPTGKLNESGNPEYKQEAFDVANPEVYAIAWDGTKVKVEIKISDLPGGLNVSEGDDVYWYYIQNAINYVASAAGEGLRVGSFISSTGTTDQAKVWNLYTSGNRDYQLWKVIEAPIKGQYYLVNKANDFKLGFGSTAASQDPTRYYTTLESATPFTINKCEQSNYYVTLKSNGGTYLLGGWASGGLYNGSGNYNTVPLAPENPLLPVKGPRGWIFIPEADMDIYYPEFSDANKEVWYYIEAAVQGRVLYDDVSASNVLKIDYKTTDADAQLWKIVKQTNATSFCDSVYIINKATKRYIAGVSTIAEPRGIVLQHLLRNDDNQFRISRESLKPALRAKADGSITEEDILPCGWGTDNAFRILKYEQNENAIKKTFPDGCFAYSENGYIKVKGTDKPFKVYTIYGVEVNVGTRQLPGVYIVKIGNASAKVLVK